MSTSPETLGQRIQRLRATAGLTQTQLAEAAAVPVTTLRSWEVDRREPGLRPACRLACALGVTAEYLAETPPLEEAGGRTPRPAGPSRRPTTAIAAGEADGKGGVKGKPGHARKRSPPKGSS